MDTTSHPDVAAFLDRYAEALAGGDLPGIAACYVVPALVVGDGAAIPVAEAARSRSPSPAPPRPTAPRAWSASGPSSRRRALTPP